MLDAATTQELENVELINGEAKTRIAMKSQQTTEDVTKMITFYKQTLIIHTWLKMK